MPGPLTVSEVLLYVKKIASDPSVPRKERQRAQRVLDGAAEPALAMRRLQQIAEEHLPHRTVSPAGEDLCRGVSVATLRDHLIRSDIRALFTSAQDLGSYIDAQSDAGAVIREMLPDEGQVAFPWTHSWLAPSRPLRGLDGQTFSSALEIGIEPPFAVFHLTVESMAQHDVLIRTPCALDSVVGRNTQWRPGGPASGVPEFVDGDIVIDAITSIEWRR